MQVKRIVTNVKADDINKAQAFYGDIFGLEVMMDLDWIKTFGAAEGDMKAQLNVAAHAGSGELFPDMSVEVDDIEEVLRRVQAAELPIEYGPVTEPWGLRRFYVRDPFGKLLNVNQHVGV